MLTISIYINVHERHNIGISVELEINKTQVKNNDKPKDLHTAI